MLAHAVGGILLCLIALKTGGRREKRKGQLSVFMFERNKGERRRGRGVPAPEMCQRSLVPPGPEHQPGTTSGGGNGVCAELCLKLGEER